MNIKVLVEQFLRKSGKFDATGAISSTTQAIWIPPSESEKFLNLDAAI